MNLNLNKWLFKNSDYSGKRIVLKSSAENISFKELTEKVTLLSSKLKKSGIKKDDKIALLAKNSTEYVVALLAIWQTGAVAVPINSRLTENEAAELISFADCKLIFSDRNFGPKIVIPVWNLKEKTEEKSPEITPDNIDFNPDNDALIIFTSGSKGKPKGVVHSFSNLINSFKSTNRMIQIERNDVLLASLPFYHIGGLMIIIRAFASGATLAIPGSVSAKGIAAGIREFDPAFISLVPTMFSEIIREISRPNPSLKSVYLGGGPSTSVNLEQFAASKWPIAKVYGSSETCSMVSLLLPEDFRKKPGSSGKPMPGCKIEIAGDSEIKVFSKSLFKGYFKTENTNPSNGFLTGDFGYFDDDGFLYIESRREDLIVTGGENINPKEIEDTINSFPGILQSTVFAENNDRWGQIICAAVSTENQTEDFYSELKKYLKGNLASFKVPKKFYFFSKLPQNEMGKIIIKEKDKKSALIFGEDG